MNTKISSPPRLVHCCQHPKSRLPAGHLPSTLILQTHAPNNHRYPKPEEADASKGWETWEHGIWHRRTSSSIPQEQTDGAGSDGTQQTVQEHPPGLLQSQQSLLDIRHPQKTGLEVKPNGFILLYSPNCGESLSNGNVMPEPGLVSLLCCQG